MFRTIFAKWRALPFQQRVFTTLLPFAFYGAYYYQQKLQNKSALLYEMEAQIVQQKIDKERKIAKLKEESLQNIAQQTKEQVNQKVIGNEDSPISISQSQEKGLTNEQKTSQVQKQQIKQQSVQQQIQSENLPKQTIQKQPQTQSTLKQQQPKPTQKHQKVQNKFTFTYKDLKQIPSVPPTLSLPQIQQENIVLVSDIGYTANFEQQLLKYLKKINRFLDGDVQIYRVTDLEGNQQLKQKLQLQLRDQTVFFIKNKYHNQFVNIDFMTYMKYSTAPFKYLQSVNSCSNGEVSIKQKFLKMSPYEAYIVLVSDKENESEEDQKKKLRAAKQAEMQLSMNNSENIKVFIMDKKQLISNKILNEENAKPNSLHLIRKANQFTRTTPNVYLQSDNKQSIPFHVIEGISFMNKKGEMLIGRYLDIVQTFSSENVYYPYTCLLTINKNKIAAEQYYKLMRTFAKLKNDKAFPNLSFMLKFDNVPYKGQKNQLDDNQDWALKIVHVNELQKQSYLHEITKRQQLEQLKINEEDWLKNSYQYLYESDSCEEQDIKKFINNALEGKAQQFYKSEKPSQLMNMHQVTANTLKASILDNNQDHVLFQYSEFCPTCKVIGPLLSYMNDLYKTMKLKHPQNTYPLFHRVNCDRNRIKEHIYTPYLPNIYYFKNEWKQYGPVRLPIQTIKQAGAMSIHDFCLITSKVGTVPWQLIEKAVDNAQKVKFEKYDQNN